MKPEQDKPCCALGRVAVVGATGLVGAEALTILSERGVRADNVTAIGSARSAGHRAAFGQRDLRVRSIDEVDPTDHDVALFCADAATARAHAPRFAHAGVTVVDNSSAFRLDPRVPLVILEVNAASLRFPRPIASREAAMPRIFANPNCSTILLLTAIEPLRRLAGVESVVVATYQAVSGAGRAGLADLRDQLHSVSSKGSASPAHFPHPCVGNVFCHESGPDPDTGLNAEERKIIDESRRLLGEPDLAVSPTCVRVPVERAHSLAITVQTIRRVSRGDVIKALRDALGLRLDADPTPLKATGMDDILVGRVRSEPSGEGSRVSLWVCGDQLRKGAALNAIQIAAIAQVSKPTVLGLTLRESVPPLHSRHTPLEGTRCT